MKAIQFASLAAALFLAVTPFAHAGKNVPGSGGTVGPIDNTIDPEGGGSSVTYTAVSATATSQIVLGGVKFTIDPSVTIPASAWSIVCKTKTQFFNNALGQAVADENATTQPSVSVNSSGKVKFTCDYKSSSKTANIAKQVDMRVNVSVRYSTNGINYKDSYFYPVSCSRSSKTSTITC